MTQLYQIAGTSGSGKSTLASSLLGANAEPHKFGNLKFTTSTEREGLVALGHYKTACGGCDGIKSQLEVLKTLEYCYANYPMVLMEGLLLVTKRLLYRMDLIAGIKHNKVIFLDTSYEECIHSVEKRRGTAGKPPEFSHGNLKSKFRGCELFEGHCHDNGIATLRLSRQEAREYLESCYKSVIENQIL